MYSGVICTQCHIVLEADAGHAGFNELGRGGERVLHDDIARLDTGVTRHEKGVQIRCEMLRGGGEELPAADDLFFSTGDGAFYYFREGIDTRVSSGLLLVGREDMTQAAGVAVLHVIGAAAEGCVQIG